jgi:tetratricopeptide (TPR) repeat protein
MRKKSMVTWLFTAFLFLPFMGCEYNRADYNSLAERMGELEEEPGLPVTDERISQLKKDIKRVDQEIENTIEKVRDKGTYYKLLGLKYMDYNMWSDGARAFDGAVAISPKNARLHYYRAVCLAQSGINESSPLRRDELFKQAEYDYLRARELDGIYISPLWGLSVLYVYEMDRPGDAKEPLDRLLDIAPNHDKALLLRAELYRADGNSSRALDLYHKIEVESKDKEIKAQAIERSASLGG